MRVLPMNNAKINAARRVIGHDQCSGAGVRGRDTAKHFSNMVIKKARDNIVVPNMIKVLLNRSGAG